MLGFFVPGEKQKKSATLSWIAQLLLFLAFLFQDGFEGVAQLIRAGRAFRPAAGAEDAAEALLRLEDLHADEQGADALGIARASADRNVTGDPHRLVIVNDAHFLGADVFRAENEFLLHYFPSQQQ